MRVSITSRHPYVRRRSPHSYDSAVNAATRCIRCRVYGDRRNMALIHTFYYSPVNIKKIPNRKARYAWQSSASAHLIIFVEPSPYRAGNRVNYLIFEPIRSSLRMARSKIPSLLCCFNNHTIKLAILIFNCFVNVGVKKVKSHYLT